MFPLLRCRFERATRRLVIGCLLVAVPIFGLSGTLVELLGHQHAHRSVAAASIETAGFAGPMGGWIDLRRAATAMTVPRAHSHAGFARHHHDHGDQTVVAIDGGLHGSAADDGGTGSGSISHVLATSSGTTALALPDVGFAWLAVAGAAVMRWTAEGPLRPPKN